MHSSQLNLKRLQLSFIILCLAAVFTFGHTSVFAMQEVSAYQSEGDAQPSGGMTRLVDSITGISLLYPQEWIEPETVMGSIFLKSSSAVRAGSPVSSGEVFVSLTIVSETGLMDILHSSSIAEGLPHFLAFVRAQAPFSEITCGDAITVGAITSMFCVNDNHAGTVIATAYSMMLIEPDYAVIAQTNAAVGELETQILSTYSILNSMERAGESSL